MEVDTTVVATGELTETQVNAEENKPAVAADAVGGDDPQANANDGELETEEQKQKRKGGWARQNERLKEENRLLREQIALKSGTQEAPEAKPAASARFDADKWRKDNPEASFEDEIDARTAHGVREALKAEKAEQGRSAQQAQFKERLDEFMDKGNEKYPGEFEDAVRANANRFTDLMTQEILDSENAVEMAYHLMEHPEELDRIAKLSAKEQIRAMTRLEDKFAKEPTAGDEKPPASKAPKPPSLVGKSGNSPKPFNPLDPTSYKDYKAFEKAMNEREMKARG